MSQKKCILSQAQFGLFVKRRFYFILFWVKLHKICQSCPPWNQSSWASKSHLFDPPGQLYIRGSSTHLEVIHSHTRSTSEACEGGQKAEVKWERIEVKEEIILVDQISDLKDEFFLCYCGLEISGVEILRVDQIWDNLTMFGFDVGGDLEEGLN